MQPFEQIRDFEHLVARFERHALRDADRALIGISFADQLHLHPIRGPAELGLVSAADEVADFVVRAGRDRGDRRVERIEVVDQTLARVAVVLKPLVEAVLLEDDAIVNAGDVASGS